MHLDDQTLGSLLGAPEISPVAKDAIRGRDLSLEPLWHQSLRQIRDQHLLSGDIGLGLDRLFQAARTGDWFFPLYSADECAQDPARRGVSLVWFPSADPEADRRPFILLVPGGGFVNVWNLTEGWPVGAAFNACGRHVFILTYQVEAESRLLEKNMEDFARALRLIRLEASRFHVSPDAYITCGFSAGGYLVCLWNTEKGYPAFGLPKPRATFPIYPLVSLKLAVGSSPDPDEFLCRGLRLYGCPVQEALDSAYEIPDHAEGFPPCALFLAADDGLVSPEHSRLLARKLDALHIPCRLEIGPEGGHGFADGSGMCMAGWIRRASAWAETLG